MAEELNLVRDLAVILISAGLFTIISKALKQPLILGYIVAGFLIGPYITFFPSITSSEMVHEWSEIGIVFLMFGLGLEFSFKKLMKAGTASLTTAGFKFLGGFVIGFIVGKAIGWTTMESIFLGGLLSMSSTLVIIKAYDEMGLKRKPYASVVFGGLVVEDLIAILLMVLLSTLAVSNRFAGQEMLLNIVKLVFFLVLWFVCGIFIIPTLLKKAKKYLNDEILLLVSIGLCFALVTMATAAGFSSALGAFLMGSILAETIESERIEHLIRPIKDLFGAIFFVSVGMMLSPAALAEHWPVILLLAVLVILSDAFFATSAGLVTGQGLENSVHAGLSLANLGEFGFIIAGVGLNLGVLREFIYPVVIAVSVITTFTAPYIIRLGEPASRFLRKSLPKKALDRIDRTERSAESSTAESSEWKKLFKVLILRIALYGILIIAAGMASHKYLSPLIYGLFPDFSATALSWISLIITLVVMGPFLYGFGISTGPSINQPAMKLLKEKQGNGLALLGLVLLRSFLVISIVIFEVAAHIELSWRAVLLIAVAGFILVIISRRNIHKYSAIEKTFLSNLNEKEEIRRRSTPVLSSVQAAMAGYDVHLDALVVSPDSSYIGQKMKDLPFRSESGANIIKIQRGAANITIPTGSETIYPYDRLLAVGTSAQLDRLRAMLEASVVSEERGGEEPFEVIPVTLGPDSYLTGHTLRNTNLRDYRCMIISVLHKDEFITNPRPDYKFESGDVVWIAGETSSCEWLKD